MLQPGDILSGYRVESVLGRGGMGTVYRASQLSMERSVALKVLSDEHMADQAFRERFRREGRVASQLDHPNILPVFEAGEAAGHLFIVMRLVDGPTMGDLIAEQGALRWQRVLEILAPIASALDAASTAGLVHRDVKPQNILIAKSGHPYLADFGLMRKARSSGATLKGDWLGSPDYAAPEHMTDAYTSAGDVYSLTTVAFHALTGRLPYERMSDLAVLHAHATAPAPSIVALNPDLPARLDEIIAWGMAKAPAQRPASASVLIEELATVLRSASLDPVLVDDALAEPSDPNRGDAARGQPRHPATDAVRGVPAGGFARTDTSALGSAISHEPVPAHSSAGRTLVEPRQSRPPVAVASPALSTPHRWPIAVACAFLLAAVAGTLAFWLGGEDADAQRVQRASFAVELPSGWRRQASPPWPTLMLSGRVTAAKDPSTTLEAGHLDRPRSGFDPLPAAHERRWRRTPWPSHVSLGAVHALRYDAVLDGGREIERTYVVPTTNGYVLLGCRGPQPNAGKVRTACDAVAVSLRVRGASAVVPGPSPATARAIVAVLDVLQRAGAQRKAGLASASNARRAAAARTLAEAYADAARKLASVPRGPQDRGPMSELERVMTSLSDHFESLAGAAAAGRRSAYAAGQQRIAAAEAQLRRALLKLRDAGYAVRSVEP